MKYLVVFLALMLSACSQPNSVEDRKAYDIHIDYLNVPFSDNRELMNDTLYILFDGNLDEDTIDVLINNRPYVSRVLSTDEIEGNAGHIATIPYRKVESIGVRINQGKLIYIEPMKDHFNIRLTYSNNQAIIKFYKFFPSYR